MKLFKTFIAVAGMALCVAGCNKNANLNANENAAKVEATDMNTVGDNNVAAPANVTSNGDKEDKGPRG